LEIILLPIYSKHFKTAILYASPGIKQRLSQAKKSSAVMVKLILGSTSTPRKILLHRLLIPFTIEPPEVAENQLPQESGYALAKRLAIAKASAVASRVDEGLIIGCDQVICLGEEIFGKPGNHEHAIKQLTKMSGKQVTSWSALCLLNAATQHMQVCVERYDVYLRTLSPDMIERYLQLEKPYQCAGSIRAEGLGVVLFERLSGEDFSSLIGLPLIQLVRFLENEGVAVV
jgi:septum formation protein